MEKTKQSTYSILLKDPRWQKNRLEVLNRDKWQCQECGDTNTCLHVHHLYYETGLKPWEYDQKHLITLCESCHRYQTEATKGLSVKLFNTLSKARLLPSQIDLIAESEVVVSEKICFSEMLSDLLCNTEFQEKAYAIHKDLIEIYHLNNPVSDEDLDF